MTFPSRDQGQRIEFLWRCFDAGADPPLDVRQIAREMGIPSSTAHRWYVAEKKKREAARQPGAAAGLTNEPRKTAAVPRRPAANAEPPPRLPELPTMPRAQPQPVRPEARPPTHQELVAREMMKRHPGPPLHRTGGVSYPSPKPSGWHGGDADSDW